MINTLITGLNSEIQQRLLEIANKYMPEINNFYQQAKIVTSTSSLTYLNNKTNIFEQMRKTQIIEKDLNIYQDIINTRQMTEDRERLNKLNNLVAYGYSILTRLGEELRGNEIKYLITYISSNQSKQLVQKVLNLDEYLQAFSLQKDGTISLMNNVNIVSDKSFLTQKQWRRLLAFQEQLRRERTFKNESQEKQIEIHNNIERYLKEKDKNLIRIVFPGDNYKKLRHYIYKYGGQTNSFDEFIKLLEGTITHFYSLGRLIEVGAALTNQKLNFNFENIRDNFNNDTIAFYKQGDFIINDIEYQSKLSNATIRLKTIINGMKKLTLIFSKFYNFQNNSRISSQAKSDAKKAEEEAYNLLQKELLDMFTI